MFFIVDIGCTAGWPITDRPHVDGEGPWTFVSPDKLIHCTGNVTIWHYQAKQTGQFRAIIFRPIVGADNQFQVVGINNISVTSVNVPAAYVVPESERIKVHNGDVIGWSGESVLAFNTGGNHQCQHTSTYSPSSLAVSQTTTFDFVEARQYSIEVRVRTE